MNLTTQIIDTTVIIKQKTVSFFKCVPGIKKYPYIGHLFTLAENIIHSNFKNKGLFLKTFFTAFAIIILSFLFVNHKNKLISDSSIQYGTALINKAPIDEISNLLARGRADIPEWKIESRHKLKSIINDFKTEKLLLSAVVIDSISKKIKAHTNGSLLNKKIEILPYFEEVGTGKEKNKSYLDNQGRAVLHFGKSIFYGKGEKQKLIGELHMDILNQDAINAINLNKQIFRLGSFFLFILSVCFSYCVEKFFPKKEAIGQNEAEQGEGRLGPYILEEKIKEGGMAELYIARKKRDEFEMRVAIKKILPRWSNDKVFINSLIDEAKMLSQFRHPNIVSIHDCGKHGDTYFIDMDYIDGKDIGTLMGCKEDITVGWTLFVMKSIYKGLAYAHNKNDDFTGNPLNIIHRDISPQNILVSYGGEVKIIDFGIGKTTQRSSNETMVGVIKGKVSYMSPEQASGKELSSRSDLFSAGIIFYELLSGKHFNRGKTEIEALTFAQNPTFTPIKEINKNIPDDLSSIVMKTLKKDVDERYQTGTEVEVDIEKFIYSNHEFAFDQTKMVSFMSKLKK